MTAINKIPTFQEKGSAGITVKDFSDQLFQSFESSKLIKIISSPIQGSSATILSGLEKCKQAGALIPFEKAKQIKENIQLRLSVQEATENLETELDALSSKDILQVVSRNPLITWVPRKPQSLENLMTQAKEGASLDGLTPEIISLVKTIISTSKTVDRFLGAGSSLKILSNESIDPRGNVLDQMLDRGFYLNEPLDSIDLSDVFPDETSALQEAALQEAMDQLYDMCEFDTGLAETAIEQTIVDYSQDIFPQLWEGVGKLRLLERMAVDQLYATYDAAVVDEAVRQAEIDYSQDVFVQLAESAEWVITKHDQKIEEIMELLDPKNGYTQEQKEHVFYSKTIWPGYQDKGEFSLFNLELNDGPINEYYFYLTDAVRDKMRAMVMEEFWAEI